MSSFAACWGALVVALAGGRSNAAPQPTVLGDRHQRIWTVADGLPQATVTSFAQTPDGYLWLGTDSGLARFNGATFTIFSADTNPTFGVHRIRTLLADNQGTLWVGIDGGSGLLRATPSGWQAVMAAQGHKNLPCVSSLQDSRGRLWFGSYGALVTVRNGVVGVIEKVGEQPVGNIQAIAELDKGVIWLGTSDGVLQLSDDDHLTAVPIGTTLGVGDTASTLALLPDENGGMWIGTENLGLLHFRDGKAITVPMNKGVGGAIAALRRDRTGLVWVATREGLGYINAQGELTAAGVVREPGIDPISLFEDNAGGVWMGTHGLGAVEFRKATFSSVALSSVTHARSASVWGTPDGSLFIGTDGGGLIRMKDGTFSSWTTKDGLCTDIILAMADAGPHQIWIGGKRGKLSNLCRLNLQTGQMVNETSNPLAAGEWIRALHRDRHADLWIGTGSRGLYRRSEQNGTIEPVALPDKGQAWKWHAVYSLFEDNNDRMWVGTNQGLYRLEQTGWRKFVAKDGLSNPMVLSMTEESNGTMWFGTFAGLTRFDGVSFQAMKRERGVTDDPVFAVVDDGAKNLWMTTTKGVFRLRYAELGPAFFAHPVRYGVHDGLPSDRVEGGEGQAAVFRDNTGRLWIPTAQGVTFTDPARLQIATAPPPIVIEQVNSDRRRGVSFPDVEVQAGPGEIDIHYAALMVGAPADRIRYRRQLIPVDKDWVDAHDRRVATYANLSPGKYTFRVSAAFEDGEFTQPPALMTLHIVPRWHEMAAVRTLGIAALLGLGMIIAIFVQRQRMARIEERHEAVLIERNRMARDLHDTLAQGFTGVSVQLEAASRALDRAPERARENLDQARGLVRSSLAEARRAVWNLRMEAMGDDETDVVGALNAVARNLSGHTPIRVQVNGRPRALPPAQAAALVRMGQEAITNAIKHAQATQVVVQLSFGDRKIDLMIKDNGTGIIVEEVPGHFGLVGMKERAAQMNGQVEIKSEPGQGTEVSIVIPTEAMSPEKLS